MGSPMIDLTELSGPELEQLQADIEAEQDRRRTLEQVPEQIDQLLGQVVAAEGHREDGEWQHPSTTGFPKGWITRRKGRRYESLISNNVWMPGDPADPQSYRWWKDLTAEEEADDTEWSGDGVEYHAGDERTYDGQWYRARQHHVSQPDWTPPAVPALWLAIEGPSDA